MLIVVGLRFHLEQLGEVFLYSAFDNEDEAESFLDRALYLDEHLLRSDDNRQVICHRDYNDCGKPSAGYYDEASLYDGASARYWFNPSFSDMWFELRLMVKLPREYVRSGPQPHSFYTDLKYRGRTDKSPFLVACAMAKALVPDEFLSRTTVTQSRANLVYIDVDFNR